MRNNVCQLPDHTRFAGRLVLVNKRSPGLESLALFVGQDNFQRLAFAEENQCVVEVGCNTLQLSTVSDPTLSLWLHLQVGLPLLE